MFYCAVLCVLFVFCNHLDGEERELVALLCLPTWCLVTFIVLWAVGYSAPCEFGIS